MVSATVRAPRAAGQGIPFGDGGWQSVPVGIDRSLLFALATDERFERLVKALPGGERASWRRASRYVAGLHRTEAVATARHLTSAHHGVSVDIFGELVTDSAEADRVVAEYRELIPELPAAAWLSVDLTHLALDADPAGAADRLEAIAASLTAGQRVQVGAEDASRTEVILAGVLEVAGRGLADRLGATVQANLIRSPADADRLVTAGVHVRLVKGAYVQASGAHSYGPDTDAAYLRIGEQLAAGTADWSIATHDDRIREHLLLMGPRTVEQLLGVKPATLHELARRGVTTRIYVPYGAHWFRYWMRRVAESRGA